MVDDGAPSRVSASPAPSAYLKITPATFGSKLLGHLQRAETGVLEDIEGLVKFTIGWYEDDQAVSATRQ
jgi:hypothetical protein